MGARKDLTGKQFGRLTVLALCPVPARRSSFVCVCECGNSTVVKGAHLLTGNTASCGCLHRERSAVSNRSHGMSQTTTYASWISMKRRCLNEDGPNYHLYGGRGIKVCDRWLNSFECFLADMGEKPAGKYSVDRIDPNGDYCPENCRWATDEEQQRNRRSNRLIEFNGRTQLLVEWSQETGIRQGTIGYRLKHGWSVADALTVPVRGRTE